MSKGPISQFMKSTICISICCFSRCSKGYEEQLANGAKMMTLAGAMSTAEIGKILQK
jgi:hypothetical protein